MGRPSKYTPELFAEICERLGKGEPLAQICRDDHMPCRSVVIDWTNADAELSLRFARARDEGYDTIAQNALEIADRADRDWEPVMSDGVCVGIKVDGEHVSRAKLMVETRLKLLAKWDPKRYGDRVTHQGDSEADAVKVDHSVALKFV